MTPRETILNQLMTVKYGSVNNFFSLTAKDPRGALLQASKYFYEFNKKGYIRPVEYDITPRNKRKEIFYYPTAKGAKYVGREEEYKYKEVRAFSTVRHDSMKFDIALSLMRLYPGWIFSFEYEPIKAGFKPDIFVRARKDDKTLYYWVEIERKPECYKDINKACGKRVFVVRGKKLNKARMH